MYNINNFEELVTFIKNNIFDREKEEIDLTFHFYDGEIDCQINEIYNGPIIAYNPKEKDVRVEFNEKYCMFDGITIIQIAKIVSLFNKYRDILDRMC